MSAVGLSPVYKPRVVSPKGLFSPVAFGGKKQSPPPKGAIYAGSFDPPTLGHLYMVEQGATLFDRLHIAIGVNPAKQGMFSLPERLEMWKKALASLPAQIHNKISLTLLPKEEFLVDFARRNNLQFLLRGIRDSHDVTFEKQLAHENMKAAPEIQTVFLMSPPHLEVISSSAVKALVGPLGWRKWVQPKVPPFVLQSLQRVHLQQRFTQTATALGIPPQEAAPVFEKLMNQYNDPTRFYHTSDHILDCLEMLDRFRLDSGQDDKIQSIPILELALWFHDYYDDRTDPNAIARSASDAITFLQKSTQPHVKDQKHLNLLENNIMATLHQPKKQPSRTFDVRLMQDIDLAILGRSPEAYLNYTQGVRKEYPSVPEELFASTRLGILQRFLKRPSIYKTPWFKQNFESSARKNLQQEIQHLQQSLG